MHQYDTKLKCVARIVLNVWEPVAQIFQRAPRMPKMGTPQEAAGGGILSVVKEDFDKHRRK